MFISDISSSLDISRFNSGDNTYNFLLTKKVAELARFNEARVTVIILNYDELEPMYFFVTGDVLVARGVAHRFVHRLKSQNKLLEEQEQVYAFMYSF